MNHQPIEVARSEDMAAYIVSGALVIYWADSDGSRGARVCWELGEGDIVTLDERTYSVKNKT